MGFPILVKCRLFYWIGALVLFKTTAIASIMSTWLWRCTRKILCYTVDFWLSNDHVGWVFFSEYSLFYMLENTAALNVVYIVYFCRTNETAVMTACPCYWNGYTEMWELTWCQLRHHWWHRSLSLCHLLVPKVNTALAEICVCVSKIKSIISIIFHAIYGAVCIQLTHFSCDYCKSTCTLSHYEH